MFSYILTSLIFYLLGYGRLNLIIIYIGIGVILLDYFFHKKNEHHHNLVIMESVSNNSPVKQINPISKLIVTLGLITIVVGAKSNIISIIVLLASIFHFIFINKLDLDFYRDFMKGPFLFILISILGIIITISRNGLGLLNIKFINFYISVTEISQEKGIQLFFLALASVSVLINFAASTPLGDVIYALKTLKTPWVLIEIMYLIYRYIFILYYVFSLLQIGANSRLGFSNLKNTYKTSMMLASRLFNKSFYMARDSYNAMESRLYNGRLEFLKNREKKEKVTPYYAFILGILIIFFLEKML